MKEFLVENVSLELLHKLTDEEAGQLFIALSEHANDWTDVEHFLTRIVRTAFIPIAERMDSDECKNRLRKEAKRAKRLKYDKSKQGNVIQMDDRNGKKH